MEPPFRFFFVCAFFIGLTCWGLSLSYFFCVEYANNAWRVIHGVSLWLPLIVGCILGCCCPCATGTNKLDVLKFFAVGVYTQFRIGFLLSPGDINPLKNIDFWKTSFDDDFMWEYLLMGGLPLYLGSLPQIIIIGMNNAAMKTWSALSFGAFFMVLLDIVLHYFSTAVVCLAARIGKTAGAGNHP